VDVLTIAGDGATIHLSTDHLRLFDRALGGYANGDPPDVLVGHAAID
jgi:hypothetical protein